VVPGKVWETKMQLKEEKTKQLARKEKKKKHTASEVPTLIYYGI